MKKISMLAAFFCLLFLGASATFAQNKATNFAGNWELDLTKSKLPERMRVESMTMNVTQTDKELKVETNTKRPAPPEGAGGGGGMGRGGGMGGGSGTVSYSLDEKETMAKAEGSGGMPASTTTLKAMKEKDGKLKLTSSRSFETPNGAMTVTTTETWELVDGGKGLKVTRNTESTRGTQTTEMYFTKKDSSKTATPKATAVNDSDLGSDMKNWSGDSTSLASQTPKRISKGVINGSAVSLAKPSYPAEAKEAKAGGAVNVQVEIDEQGNVISASAVSGHPLLQSAAVEAAKNSKFAPTTLQGNPVKVTGVIVYNFVAQ
jgi:TonB family protein